MNNEPKRDPRSRYYFKGAVMHFDRVVEGNFRAETMASSTRQARGNILHQFKKKAGLEPYAGGYRLDGMLEREA